MESWKWYCWHWPGKEQKKENETKEGVVVISSVPLLPVRVKGSQVDI